MTIAQTATTSFKVELFQAVHNFGPASPDTFKLALYTATADLGANTTVYTATGETSGAGYVAGGNTLTDPTVLVSGTTAYVDFADTAWTSATFTARGALIYNASKGNKAVAVLDFGADKTAADRTFTVVFPAADPSSAIVRIS
jgi:hypothetical protein